jgi:hypothetical protein
MLINKHPFTFTLVVVYLDDIYFVCVTNLTFKWQLCFLELPDLPYKSGVVHGISKAEVLRTRNAQSSLESMTLRPYSTLKKGSEILLLALFYGLQDLNSSTDLKKFYLILC